MRKLTGAPNIVAVLGALLLIVGLLGAPGIGIYRLASIPVSSWNSHVPCQATPILISQLFTGWNTTTGGPTVAGTTIAPLNQFYSIYSDQGKHALTAPYPHPPPCTGLTVGTGTAISPNGPTAPTFIEIDNLIVDTTARIQDNAAGGDCTTAFAPYNGGASMNGQYCDAYGNLEDVTNYTLGCEAGLNPTVHRLCIRVHIDNNWKAAGFCGTGTACDNATLDRANDHVTHLDLQGFLWYNNGAPPTQGRAFSPWELRPVTGVRLHVTTPSLGASLAISPQAPIVGSPVTFSVSTTGGVPPYTYCFTYGDTPGVLCIPQTSSTGTHTYTTPGTYNGQVLVTDQSSPAQSVTVPAVVTVVSPTPPLTSSFTFTPASPMVGATVTYASSVSGGIAPYQISWNFGDTFTGTGPTITHAYAAPGVYTITMAATDSGNPISSSTTSKSIQIQPPPIVQLSASMTWSPTIAITQQGVTFTAIASGGTPPYGYSWNFGDGGGSVPLGSNPTHFYGNPGRYNVTLTVTDSANGQTTVLTTLTVQSPAGSGGGGPITFSLTIPPTWAILALSGAGVLLTGVVLGLARRPRLR